MTSLRLCCVRKRSSVCSMGVKMDQTHFEWRVLRRATRTSGRVERRWSGVGRSGDVGEGLLKLLERCKESSERDDDEARVKKRKRELERGFSTDCELLGQLSLRVSKRMCLVPCLDGNEGTSWRARSRSVSRGKNRDENRDHFAFVSSATLPKIH